ncbi:MAG: phosphate acyltransferase PlsX [Alphaproteobacteria bacterium]|nr:phosphate acyltransferase PlsX [Alphaproteobacteria bacterium]OJV13865.1 MAG: hypothetical protein BGO27_08215 [Alphaproteobacteria bacterium 33-17]
MQRSNNTLVIALDVMGGDHGYKSMISGAAIAAEKNHDIHFRMFGDETKILPECRRHRSLQNRYTIIHTDEIVSSNDTPAYAIRNARRSSMRLAIEDVKVGISHAVVSSGNTGALMALSKVILRMLSSIERPAIAGIIPTVSGKSILLDMGANIDCSASILMQFALMGSNFAKIILGLDSPKVAVLNVGSEEIKGSDTIKLASQMIRECKDLINFVGYVEGDGIVKGSVDVIVTDGFTGNVALKTAEGTAKLCREFLKQSFESSILAKIGYLFAKKSIKNTFSRLDHRYYNGAMLLGLDGIVVKSHGSADEIANANAIGVAANLAKSKINSLLTEALDSSINIHGLLE